MKSQEYRDLVATIVRNALGTKLPIKFRKEVATKIAIAVHARMYGAHVDGVASPLWREDYEFLKDFPDVMPTKTAQELLDD